MIILYIILGIVFLVLILALIAPKKYDVNRSIVISKPKEMVFNYLTFLKNQNEWSPWKLKDPNMKQEYVGVDGEVGFISKWEGNKDVGSGEQELISIQPHDRIEVQLRFFKPWKSQSVGYYTVEEIADGQVKVVWGFHGKNPIPFNVFMLFFNFEKAVSKDFDEGLAKLKNILETK